jgi:hypothetical protein
MAIGGAATARAQVKGVQKGPLFLYTDTDQKRSCGFALHIQMLINAKYGMSKYQLDREHLPLYPEFEDNEVVMDEDHPTSVKGKEEIAEAKAAIAAKKAVESSAAPKSKADQILEATQRIEQHLVNIVQSQESL